MAGWKNPIPGVRSSDSWSLRQIFQSLEAWFVGHDPVVAAGGLQPNVTGTTAAASVLSGVLVSEPQVGDVYRLRAWGTFTNSTNGSVNYTMNVLFGGVTYLGQAVTMALGSSVNVRSWVVDLDVVVSSLTTQSLGMSSIWSNSNGALGSLEMSSGSSGYIGVGADTATFDFTVNPTASLELQVAMGSTAASARCYGFSLVRFR